MKKFITIMAIIAVTTAMFVVIGCGSDDNPIVPDQIGGGRIFGEVVAVDGNRVTMNALTMQGMDGAGGRVIMSGQDGADEQRVTVIGDEYEIEDLECEPENDEYIIWERDDSEDGEFVARQRIAGADAETDRVRMAGADAETDRIRVGGEDGQQMMVTGEMPPFERAGHAVSVVVPRSIDITVGTQGNETADISTLERGDIVLVLFDEEGRMNSVRLLPDARIGE